MADNINSFAQNLSELTKSCADIMEFAEGINETLSGADKDYKVTEEIVLPSYANIVNRVERVENTVSKFTQGSGVVETTDGTYRKVRVTNVSRPPAQISGLDDVSTFTIDPNWFFEELQYPRCKVRISLKDHIDDNSDRAYVTRVILDATKTVRNGQMSMKEFYDQYISGQELSYNELITLLENNSIEYREDKDEVKLPLCYEKYYGRFAINSTSLIKDNNGISRQWFTLNTLSYYYVNEDGVYLNNAYTLNVNDLLRYGNSVYKIVEINLNTNSVRLEATIGYDQIGTGVTMELYNDPFAEKDITVGIGIDEINIIYVKAVNEEFNLISNDWSDPISFYTNELIFDDDETTTFEQYYTNNVSDFGKVWIAQTKEGQIDSINGKQPYAPVLNADDLRVVQINTQLESRLDMDKYNSLTTQIASTKSSITSLRGSIATNKDLLIQTSDSNERTNIINNINTDTETLNSTTAQYNSLVEELNTMLNNTGAISYSPKYHIRGFFSIPRSRYTIESNNANIGEQVIIGFDIRYRYIHTDETGVSLNTYEYTNSDNTIQSGVFTDWNIVQSATLTKKYDDDLGKYIWDSNDTTDGTQININQIDIPITRGEKVEIMVRSISEAGYPYNPLRSEWSNSVIVEFPENLSSEDSVSSIMDSNRNDMISVMLQQTIASSGIPSHMSDSNSTFKHTCDTVSFLSKNGINSYEEMSLQTKIESIDSSINKIIIDTSTLANIITYVSNLQSTIKALDASLRQLTSNFDVLQTSVSDSNKYVANLNVAYKDMALRVEDASAALQSFIDYTSLDKNYKAAQDITN